MAPGPQLKFIFPNSLETLIKTNIILKSTVTLQGYKEGHFSGSMFTEAYLTPWLDAIVSHMHRVYPTSIQHHAIQVVNQEQYKSTSM